VDSLLIAYAPNQINQFSALVRRHQGWSGAFADGHGIPALLCVLFGVAPITPFAWLAWRLLA
jgi:hypothetical protein